LLLPVLIFVVHTAWVARGRAADWKTSVRVAVYRIAGDDSAVTSDYVRALRVETLQPIAAFMKREAAR
jgi:hypothetical protein